MLVDMILMDENETNKIRNREMLRQIVREREEREKRGRDKMKSYLNSIIKFIRKIKGKYS